MASLPAKFRFPAATLLVAASLFGYNAMWVQPDRSGYNAEIERIVSDPEGRMPGSNWPVLRRYTGHEGLDGFFTFMSVIFANAADGTWPELCLYTFQFAGQIIPIYFVCMVEGVRAGNRWTAFFFPVFWGTLMQLFGYGNVFPVYTLLHLFTSATARPANANASATLLPRNSASLSIRNLTLAFGIGYVVPSFLLAYPFADTDMRQRFSALWQPWPIYVSFIHTVLSWSTASPAGPTQRRNVKGEMASLSRAYDLVFTAATATQLLTYAIIAAAKVTPGLFPEGVAETLTLGRVFVPGPIYSYKPMVSVQAQFLDWILFDQYTGGFAGLVWAATLYLGASGKQMGGAEYATLAKDVLSWTVVAGPAGAYMRLLQKRDQLVLLGAGAGKLQ